MSHPIPLDRVAPCVEGPCGGAESTSEAHRGMTERAIGGDVAHEAYAGAYTLPLTATDRTRETVSRSQLENHSSARRAAVLGSPVEIAGRV